MKSGTRLSKFFLGFIMASAFLTACGAPERTSISAAQIPAVADKNPTNNGSSASNVGAAGDGLVISAISVQMRGSNYFTIWAQGTDGSRNLMFQIPLKNTQASFAEIIETTDRVYAAQAMCDDYLCTSVAIWSVTSALNGQDPKIPMMSYLFKKGYTNYQASYSLVRMSDNHFTDVEDALQCLNYGCIDP